MLTQYTCPDVIFSAERLGPAIQFRHVMFRRERVGSIQGFIFADQVRIISFQEIEIKSLAIGRLLTEKS